jgi:hypothetical protein
MTRIALFAAAALAATSVFTGCKTKQTTAGGNPATFHAITGDLTFTVDAPLNRAWGAAQAAVEELQFRTTGTSKDAIQGILNAKAANDDAIKITIEKRTEQATDVTVGVGPFGKQHTARLVGDTIHKHL